MGVLRRAMHELRRQRWYSGEGGSNSGEGGKGGEGGEGSMECFIQTLKTCAQLWRICSCSNACDVIDAIDDP